MKSKVKKIEHTDNYNDVLNIIYDEISALDRDLLITFQESLELFYTNHKNYKSYEWLKERIGFYPVWTMRIAKGISKENLSSIIQATLSWRNRYVYLIDPNELEVVDTYLYAWCDVHDIENNGCETDSDDAVRLKYSEDWKGHILIDNYKGELEIQTLVKDVKESNIIRILDKGKLVNKRMHLI